MKRKVSKTCEIKLAQRYRFLRTRSRKWHIAPSDSYVSMCHVDLNERSMYIDAFGRTVFEALDGLPANVQWADLICGHCRGAALKHGAAELKEKRF